MTVEIGGAQASLEEIAEAITILASRKDSTSIKQLLEPHKNVLAYCDYHKVAQDYLDTYPERALKPGTKQHHSPRTKNAFIGYLTDRLLANGLNTDTAIGQIDLLNASGDVPAEFEEGNLLVLSHRVRERSQALVAQKKITTLTSQGALTCEVCDFDFHSFYGKLGEAFIEAHHVVPLSRAGHSKTKLADLALVCSNCHRMLHRALQGGKECTPAGLRAQLAQTSWTLREFDPRSTYYRYQIYLNSRKIKLIRPQIVA